MIRSEQLLRDAREQDHTCEFCYYELFDDKAYPCSRCVCNQPAENMWRPKIEDEPTTEDCSTVDKDINVRSKDEPQIDCKTCRHNKSGWYEKGCLSCGKCCGDNFEFYEPKEEPQTERESE